MERIVTDEVLHSQIVPKVTHIITSLGTIHCEYFVNASGMVSVKFQVNDKDNLNIKCSMSCWLIVFLMMAFECVHSCNIF